MWHIAVDPALGRRTPRQVESVLGRAAIESEVTIVPPQELPEHTAAVIAAGHTRLGIAGGDADLAALCDAVLGAGAAETVIVALIPVQHPSSLLRMFALPHRQGPAHHLEGTSEYTIDVLTVAGEHGTSVAVASVGAGIAAGPPGKLSWRGGLSEVTLALPTRTIVRRARGILICNAQFWGPTNPAPRAMLDDGRFDVQVLSPTRRRTRRLGVAMRRGRHIGLPDVMRASASAVEMDVSGRWRAAIDGRPGATTPLSIRTLPGAVRLKI